MAQKRSYEFIDSSTSNPAKRQQQSGGTGRRQGKGCYGEVSKRGNDLKKGLGACWRCQHLKKTCDGEDTCQECRRNLGGFWALHPNLGCRRGKLEMLANSLFPDYPSPPNPGLAKDCAHLSFSDLLLSIKTGIKRLTAKGILKTGLYSYVIDLIEEDITITNSDMLVVPAFQSLSTSLQLCNSLIEGQSDASPSVSAELIQTMKTSIVEYLKQLSKVIRKKTGSAEILTIMFTILAITIGAEIRMECFTLAKHNLDFLKNLYESVQTKWHDTVIALFSACKDLKVSGNIEESIFEITSWKLEYVKLLAEQAAQYQKPHISTTLGVEGRLVWKLTTLHAKFFTACAEGNEKLVQSLLSKAPGIRADSNAGWSGLHWASNNGHASIVSLLAHKGENVCLQDINGWSPLYIAARNQQDNIVSMLLDLGAEIDAETDSGSTALHQATELGHISTIRLLLDRNANIHKRNGREETALHLAIVGRNTEIVNLLVKRGADLKLFNIYGEAALHLAAANGLLTLMEIFINHGAELDVRDGADATPLHKAAKNGHEAAVDLLIQKGVNIKAMNISHETAVFMACKIGHKKMVALLLGGSNFRLRTKNGNTTLHAGTKNGHEAVVKLLLETGQVVVDSKDDDGRTPLSWAAANGHEAVVKLLLETGQVVVDSKDDHGQTPLSLAAWNGHKTVVTLLETVIVSVNAGYRMSNM